MQQPNNVAADILNHLLLCTTHEQQNAVKTHNIFQSNVMAQFKQNYHKSNNTASFAWLIHFLSLHIVAAMLDFENDLLWPSAYFSLLPDSAPLGFQPAL